MKCAAIKNDGAPCTQGISTGCTILVRTDDGDFDYEVCRNHFNKYQRTLQLKLNPERRRKHHNVAVIEDTHIDLQSGVETTQERLPLDNSKEKNTMSKAHRVMFYAVVTSGFKTVNDTPTFFWWKRGETTVTDEQNVIDKVTLHFQMHTKTAYVLVRDGHTITCFKRDLTNKVMGNVLVKKSNFS